MSKAIRRLYCDRVEAALAYLKDGRGQEPIRNVRREIKKMRAILRLVRREIGKSYSRHVKALRKASDRLTNWRDAHAALAALGKLSDRQFPEFKEYLREKCRAGDGQSVHSVKAIERTLRKLKGRDDDLKVVSRGWAAIGPGFKKSYRRGRNAWRMAAARPTSKNFHEWRKRVKDLWFQSRLLCPALPKKRREALDGLKEVADALGTDHDLVVLQGFMKSRRGASTLDRRIHSRQMELRAKALRVGRRFYAEKPSCFCSGLGKCWEDWR